MVKILCWKQGCYTANLPEMACGRLCASAHWICYIWFRVQGLAPPPPPSPMVWVPGFSAPPHPSPQWYGSLGPWLQWYGSLGPWCSGAAPELDLGCHLNWTSASSHPPPPTLGGGAHTPHPQGGGGRIPIRGGGAGGYPSPSRGRGRTLNPEPYMD